MSQTIKEKIDSKKPILQRQDDIKHHKCYQVKSFDEEEWLKLVNYFDKNMVHF